MLRQNIIDVHTHIYPDKIAHKAIEFVGRYYGLQMTGQGTVEHLMRVSERNNISYCVVHGTATRPDQVKSVNDFIREATRENDRLIGFYSLHPLMVNLKKEIDRLLSLGCIGIKLHPDFQNFSLDSPEAVNLFSLIKGKFIVMVHMGDANSDYSSPVKMKRIIGMFPELTVIAAHFGGYLHWEEAEEYLVGRNIYFDTSSSLFLLPPEQAVRMIRKHGSEKFMFGTDYPMWTVEEELERFYRLPLTEGEKEAVLYHNAYKLLISNTQ